MKRKRFRIRFVALGVSLALLSAVGVLSAAAPDAAMMAFGGSVRPPVVVAPGGGSIRVCSDGDYPTIFRAIDTGTLIDPSVERNRAFALPGVLWRQVDFATGSRAVWAAEVSAAVPLALVVAAVGAAVWRGRRRRAITTGGVGGLQM
ncbi:MAG: hypothetical protein ACRDD1_05670, partial [Planctomycetia bacterium]